MKAQLLTTVGAAALLTLSQMSGAEAGRTLVGSIYGVYDAECGNNINCNFGGAGYTVNYDGNTGNEGDTPSLFIVNPSNYTMTGVSITATGYQGDNNGVVQSMALPDIPSKTVLDVIWSGSTNTGNMFAYDYDDEYGFTASNSTCNTSGVGNGYCALVGNFDLKFAATLNGTPIASDSSPSPSQGGGNAQNAFIGWEGLNPLGWSESTYDNHSGTESGVLAYIYTGTTGRQSSVPEPATLALLGAGVGALGLARRRRKRT